MEDTTKIFKVCRLLQTEVTEYYSDDLEQSQIDFYKEKSRKIREGDEITYPLVVIINNKHNEMVFVRSVPPYEIENCCEDLDKIYNFNLSKNKEVDISRISVDAVIFLLTILSFPQVKRVIKFLPPDTSDEAMQYIAFQIDLVNSFLNNPKEATLLLETEGSPEENWSLTVKGIWKDN